MNLEIEELKRLKAGLFRLMDKGVNGNENADIAVRSAEQLIRLIQLNCLDVSEDTDE